MLRMILALSALTACASADRSPSPSPSPSPKTPAASPEAIEAMAAGTYDLEPMVRRHMYVLEVTGASSDPSGRTPGEPRATRDLCGAEAKAAIIATAKAMVDRAKQYGNPIECDLSHVATPDPTFGALPATSSLGARPGHPFQYAVCTQAGVAEYDRTLQLYFRAPSLHVFGILDTEVGSALADEDLAILDGKDMEEILRCP